MVNGDSTVLQGSSETKVLQKKGQIGGLGIKYFGSGISANSWMISCKR
jgi:hypothetical protein